MKIIRNGIEIELTEEELRNAHNEFHSNWIRDEIIYTVENECAALLDDERPPQAFLDEIGMSFDEMISDIEDEYRIHCENYECFGLDEPNVKEFVINALSDYGFYNYCE